MDPNQFIGLLLHPEQMDETTGPLLGQVIREYPYCQPAQMLYLLTLLKQGDLKFNEQLRLAATYSPDRRVLYKLVNSLLGQEPLGNRGPVAGLEGSGISAPSSMADPQKPEMVRQVEKSCPLPEADLIHFGFPPGRRGEFPDPEPPKVTGGENNTCWIADEDPSRNTGTDLIEQFIRNNERTVIRPDGLSASEEDLSADSLKEDDEMLTETLARIYIQQGYYHKALQAYEKLSLKFPGKSITFAIQIEKLRDLIKNQ